MSAPINIIGTCNYSANTTSYSLDVGEKFSDYSILLFLAHASSSVRGSLLVPTSKFNKGNDNYIAVHGGNGVSSISFKYTSDTSINAIMNSTYNIINIYGIL